MAPPKRKAGGRVTPKGTRPGQLPTAPAPVAAGEDAPRHASMASSRYTPPIPKTYKESPRWVPVLMFALLGIGVVVIILNYLGLLPSAPTNWYLLVGLAGILGGIVTATQFR